jgi:adenylate cyclase
MKRTLGPALVGFWQWVRASTLRKGVFLLLVVLMLVAAGHVLPTSTDSFFAKAERAVFDIQMRLLRDLHPRPLGNDVVLVGVDEETEAVYIEPFALWHRHFAAALHALAKADPLAVGVDFVLPERSYDGIVKGLDLALMRALVDMKSVAPLVYVHTIDNRGAPVPVQPNYLSILGPKNLGSDQHLRDPDDVSRRFSERDSSVTAASSASFPGQLLRAIGRPVGEGYIDYSLGAALDYVPLHELVDAAGDPARLRKMFGGRVVLIGSVLRRTDRWPLPAKLTARDLGAYGQPGVLVHLQTLRSHLAKGLLKPVPDRVRWVMMLVAMLVVFASTRPALVFLGGLVLPLALLAAGLVAIAASQRLLPVASFVLCAWIAFVVRGVFDAIEAVVERLRLQQSFAGQVSPAVMREMLAGSLSPGLSGQQAEVCVLFSDVRDFTTLSENMPPKVVTTVLQRYFDRMVHAVHRYDGTVDKFIGDGMMVLFGAPRKSQDPCSDAVRCSLAMLQGLDELNAEFEREGLPTLTIGIGINYGTVTVGNIGSSERHNYSAIGDAVNVAARVEGLTKVLRRKIVITEAVVSRIEERFHFDPLGSHNVKGHSPVNVWGIRTARTAPASVEAEAAQ